MRKKLVSLSLIAAIVVGTFLPTPAHAAPVNFTVNSNASKGTVTGPGINCGSDCSEPIEDGTVITLTATPQPGWMLTQGDGCPDGFHTSTVTCTKSINIGDGSSAYFLWALTSHNVTAKIEGTGSGTVSGTGTYAFGTTYTLVATPSAGSVFAGWQTSGDICRASGAGKGTTAVNPSPTCSEQTGGSTSTLTAVARFDKASSSQTPSNTQTTTNNNTAAPTPTQEVAKPTAPTLDNIAVDDMTYKSTDKITVASNEPLVLKGKTIPNGKVTLYIFSEPKKYEIQADAEGKWSYSVTGLPPGDHHAEIEVTDPTTNKTSDRARLIAFTVTAPSATQKSNDPTQDTVKKSTPWVWAAIGVITPATAAGIGLVVWKHKHPDAPLSSLNPFKRK